MNIYITYLHLYILHSEIIVISMCLAFAMPITMPMPIISYIMFASFIINYFLVSFKDIKYNIIIIIYSAERKINKFSRN